MTTTPTPPRAETEAMIAEVLSHYPAKAAKFRAKHLKANDPEGSKECEVKSNIKSRPGVMTIRGCAYAGSKGVVWGPVKDLVTISHGPVGCGQYSWATRRNYARGPWGVTNFAAMQVTTDFQEKDIVFGGDPKLAQVCDEINELFPLAKGISVQSECPIGLIGDDIEATSRAASKKLGKPVIPVRCEGFRGVSQSLGHHIANDAVRDHVLGTGGENHVSTPYDVALIGDYNIGGDVWASRRILEDMGLRIIAQWSGDGTINEMASTHLSKLNLIHCYRSMNYICTTMEERYGTPWMEFNFFGPSKIVKSMRAIAEKFDETIQAKTEAAIARYQKQFDEIIKAFRPRLEGKRVMLAVGGLRPRHTIGAYEDLGMEVIGTGYEFAHKDDYTRTYGMLKEGTVLYDDPTAFELEEFAKFLKPDLMGAGVKEKYVFHKMGIPFRQMHSWDYSGPYHGVDGFAIFARDMDIAINSPTWDLMETPWSKSGEVS
ncbi:nitrogenase molybdenum-iron protein alpha chain [Parafrankia sp. EUN1f]|uniref:nitrogenase molybdenum-iron protein alpha chain n=1 Tax=Parafrankia sp. EUN1f TaxID=102897 RepID=UPI0001C43EF9|nr:nitrogenase molybdenum-iron protein alpha chain [Parafrankia sp. EUN1f]EFC83884.1 nitrogenase molybdenum-iron protein alpha chain [Parafrankia sp. EUN1f]